MDGVILYIHIFSVYPFIVTLHDAQYIIFLLQLQDIQFTLLLPVRLRVGRSSGDIAKGVPVGELLTMLSARSRSILIRHSWKKSCGRDISSWYNLSKVCLNRVDSPVLRQRDI